MLFAYSDKTEILQRHVITVEKPPGVLSGRATVHQ